ncbi:Surfeit locus protein 1 [Sparganum proliferum]
MQRDNRSHVISIQSISMAFHLKAAAFSALSGRRLCCRRRCMAVPTRYFGTEYDEDGEKKIGFRHFLLLICPLTAFSLGYWQIQRRRWKLALIEKIENLLPTPPIPLPKDAKASTDLLEFQPVTVEGYFDHSREVLIGPRSIITDEIPFGGYGSAWGSKPPPEGHKQSNLSNFGAPSSTGYFVVTPFELKDRPGTFILVNRGWIPTCNRDPFARKAGQVEGLVKINGCIRYNEKPLLAPDPKPLNCCEPTQAPHIQYFGREISRMSEYLHTLPLFIDANYDSTVKGGPVGGQTRVNIRNEHLQYIFTWFTLGTVTLGMDVSNDIVFSTTFFARRSLLDWCLFPHSYLHPLDPCCMRKKVSRTHLLNGSRSKPTNNPNLQQRPDDDPFV